MRKTFGLCFLALTLTAGTASAQGLFLEKGQPGISVANGEAVIGTGWSSSLMACYTYRGVFDLGLNVTRYSYGSGTDEDGLSAIGLMPFANVYFARAEDGPLPISVSGTFGFERRLFTGNGGAPNPDGWGMLVGASIFRRIDFNDFFAGIPELFLAYDLQSITWHSKALDATQGAPSPGERTDYANKPRVLLRANMSFQVGKAIALALSPYVGYQAGLAVGANVGLIF